LQEGRTIACIAKIQKLIDGFFTEVTEPYLINPITGEEYENPASDMHTAGALALYSELKHIPIWDLVKEAKKDMGGWSRRQRGKILGFTVIYGGGVNRISSALQVELQLAEKLLGNYFTEFPELKQYIDNTSTLAKYQGWITCPVTNRRYWVRESNAHGLSDDNTIARRSCNTLVQGLSAVMSKIAMTYVDKNFEELNRKYSSDIPEGKAGRIVAAIHDEILTYIPGQGRVIDVKEKEGIWVPEHKWQPISYEYARAQENGMKKAMDELLHPLVPDFPSKADCALGTSWAAK